jgi:hypothetical protein
MSNASASKSERKRSSLSTLFRSFCGIPLYLKISVCGLRQRSARKLGMMKRLFSLTDLHRMNGDLPQKIKQKVAEMTSVYAKLKATTDNRLILFDDSKTI